MSHQRQTQSADQIERGERAMTDPTIAWHYTNGPGLISILSGHSLWATSSWFLNDKEEVALGAQRIGEQIRSRTDADFADELVKQLQDEAWQPGLAAGHFYILSASASWDSLAMWRLYGGARESYAIGIDATRPLSILANHPGLTHAPGLYLRHQTWQPVRYGADDQRALVDEVLDNLPERLGRFRDAFGPSRAGEPGTSPLQDPFSLPEPIRADLQDLMDDLQQALLLIKHEGFIDERETRYSVVLVAGPESSDAASVEARLLHYRSTAYGMAPYLRLTGSPDSDSAIVDDPAPLPIKAVSISPSPNGEVATASLSQLLAAHGYDDVPVLRSGIPFRA